MTRESNDIPNSFFDRESWHHLLPMDALPLNRRMDQRRQGSRRKKHSPSSENEKHRHPTALDRRQQERRGVQIRLPIHSSVVNTYQYLRNMSNWPRLSPAIVHLKNTAENIWEIALNISGATVRWSLRVLFDDSKHAVLLRRVDGQIENCDGEILVSEMPGATLVTVNLYVNFGFGAFERFMGHVLKSKVREGIETILRVAKSKLERANPLPPKFAFLIHSTDVGMYGDVMRDKPCPQDKKPLLEWMCAWIPPFKGSHIYGIETPAGKMIEGDFIYSALTPRLIVEGDRQMVLSHMIQAGRLAEELGAKILGLGAYAALIGRHGVQIDEALSIPVTTGSVYTVRAALDAFFKVAYLAGIKLKNAHVAVIGATGALASVCVEFLAPEVGKLSLIARQLVRLQNLAEKTKSLAASPDVEISLEINKTASQADMVLICTSSPDALLDVRHLKPGTIVCDVSQPNNVSKENAALRKDILVIAGGVIQPPGDVRFNFYFGLPPGRAFACMAETMILTLEERFEAYSIGGNITVEKVKEIGMLAEKHGFQLGDLKSFGRTVTTEDLERIKQARQ